MLGRRLPTILSPMTLVEAIETTRIHSVARLTGDRTVLHHPPVPGEVVLAHHSVLFRDEFPGCRRHVLEVLRQPLEEGVICRQAPARHRSASAGRPWRYERSMFPAKGDEGPSESCPLIEDRYRSKPLG